jgi:hypothetical protein
MRISSTAILGLWVLAMPLALSLYTITCSTPFVRTTSVVTMPSAAVAAALPTPSDKLQDYLQQAAAHAWAPLDKLVFVCVVNDGFKHFALNLFLSTRRTIPQMNNFLFYTTDEGAATYLRKHGALVYHNSSSNFSTKAEPFRSSGYSKIVNNKARVAYEVIQLGYDVFILDADVVVLRNPMNYLIDIPKCDMTVSVEVQNVTRFVTPGPERYSGDNFEAGSVSVLVNTGVIMWRNTADARTSKIVRQERKSDPATTQISPSSKKTGFAPRRPGLGTINLNLTSFLALTPQQLASRFSIWTLRLGIKYARGTGTCPRTFSPRCCFPPP